MTWTWGLDPTTHHYTLLGSDPQLVDLDLYSAVVPRVRRGLYNHQFMIDKILILAEVSMRCARCESAET